VSERLSLRELFYALPLRSEAEGIVDAAPLSNRINDYVGRGESGEPLVLIAFKGSDSYKPPIQLRHIAIDFAAACRVKTDESGIIERNFVLISCSAEDPALFDFFLKASEGIVSSLPGEPTLAQVHRHVELFVELFRRLLLPSPRSVKGLWAELFVLASSSEPEGWLNAWHVSGVEKFDFAWPKFRIEVKATEMPLRVHEFSLHQLDGCGDATVIIVSILLRRSGSGEGVMDDLADRIVRHLDPASPLVTKLWMNVAESLGSDFSDQLDVRFDSTYAAQSLRAIRSIEIPRPVVTDSRVHDVHFKVDVSGVAERSAMSLEGVCAAVLRSP
jgi:hypothetical protein